MVLREEKNLPAWGHDRPPGIVLKKKVFPHGSRKSPNPRIVHTQGDVTLVGPISLPVLWPGASERIFLPFSLKSAPIGVQTQNLKGATRTA
jgi:hypothetical protein